VKGLLHICLTGKLMPGANEAFFAATGHSYDEAA
jgi:hypothetical protein